MPHFFFHSHNQDQTYLDPEEMNLTELTAAVGEAALSAREMMADELRHGPVVLGRSFDTVGDDGQVLAIIAFHDCLYRAL